jgi:hypothetical protein
MHYNKYLFWINKARFYKHVQMATGYFNAIYSKSLSSVIWKWRPHDIFIKKYWFMFYVIMQSQVKLMQLGLNL